MYRHLLLMVIFFLSISVNAQTKSGKYRSTTLSIISDNDNYLSLQDRYYTNGMAIGLSFLKSKDPGSLTKTITRYQVGQEIYTPSNIKENDITQFDRPYAGYLYLQTTLSKFKDQRSRIKIGLDAGVIGAAAGGYFVQSSWHHFVNYTHPQGWRYQIKNTFVFNISGNYKNALPVFKWADLVSHIGAQAGTAFNDLSMGLQCRMGKLAPINYSALFDSRIGNISPQTTVNDLKWTPKISASSDKEYFVFFGITGQAVFYNALIQGNVFNPYKSPHTEDVIPFLMIQEYGFVYSIKTASLKLIIYRLSPEVFGGDDHHYLRIDLNFPI